ncbi:MAG: DHH family phosphoesterase [Bacteroidaceae bacterium]|nr:DHH family phosphoesterase [Bacteroidaceae bacterium]
MKHDTSRIVLPELLPSAELMRLMLMIREAQHIVVTAHHGPDGDAVGSTLAWAAYLRRLGKQVTIALPSWFPDFLKWMPGSRQILIYRDQPEAVKNALRQADLVCSLDYNELSRLNLMEDAVARCSAPRLLIDHHEEPNEEQFSLLISRPKMSSTCELVLRLLVQLGAYPDMTRSEAACLYTGIMTDTGNFAYNSNDANLYLFVSLLLRKGVDKESIYKKVYQSWSVGKFTLWNDALSQWLTFHAGGHASVFMMTREMMKSHKFIRGDAEGLVNEPLKIHGMKLSISLREDTEEDVVRVSLRSTDGFHCREMAERYFNGGGHEDASGGTLPFPIEEAYETTKRAIEAYEAELSQS